MRARTILAAAALTGGILLASTGTASASSPYGCDKVPGATGTACYQIVGSGSTVDFFQGKNGSSRTLAVTLYGPKGDVSGGSDNLAPGQAWEVIEDRTMPLGSYCAAYGPPGAGTLVTLCYKVE
jgi:hypothetical protein